MKQIKKVLEAIGKKIWNIVQKYKVILFLLLITAISVFIRLKLLNFKSGDYVSCLEPWFNQLKASGGILGLKEKIGNYNMPYMTILALLTYLPVLPIISIKVVSIVFDYLGALGAMLIVRKLLKNSKNMELISILTYCILIILPTVLLNSAAWAQADSIYSAFAIWALYFLMDEKYIKAFIFLGLSMAFKLQFIFVLPIFILVYISKRKFSVFHFAIIPLVDIILCIPAILVGKGLFNCINIYIEQMVEYDGYLSLNFPSIYSLFFNIDSNYIYTPNECIPSVGVWLTISIFVFMAFIILYKKIKLDSKAILAFSLWSVMICTFLLPHMHDRYLYIGDILSIVYFAVNRDNIYVPIIVNVISLYGYCWFLFGGLTLPLEYVAIAYLITIVLFTKNIFKKYLGIDLAKKEITLQD